MQFKKEAILLVAAIALFGAATFLYTYQATSTEASILSQSLAYPYRGIALCFVGIGFASMIVASISYQRKTKKIAATQV
jgi:TRAP-type C4-dicarboxylate transport system permease small subunit